jgi:hypothetical protein
MAQWVLRNYYLNRSSPASAILQRRAVVNKYGWDGWKFKFPRTHTNKTKNCNIIKNQINLCEYAGVYQSRSEANAGMKINPPELLVLSSRINGGNTIEILEDALISAKVSLFLDIKKIAK